VNARQSQRLILSVACTLLAAAALLAAMPIARARSQAATESTVHLTPAATSDTGDDSPTADATELAKKLQNPIGDLYSLRR
jgi:hypothetical protein